VEQPTYMGALQAFVPFEPEFVSVACDDDGPLPDGLNAAANARFLYLLPNFQNPSGRCLSEERRMAIAARAEQIGLPILEDNPYGELWFDRPPPASMASRWPEGTLYLGSFSKVLAPGLRLGYVVSPNKAVGEKLLQAKQAADLHTGGFNQRLVYEVIRSGFLTQHVPTIRARYAAHRDAMQAALVRHMPPGCHWTVPMGGMFFWIQLPAGVESMELLELALERGVAFIPGAPFYANRVEANTLRLSFVTVSPAQIDKGVAALAEALKETLAVAVA
ncbi:MAG: aminotransferase, partial [Rhizobacter sp.]|nr:aminotransferase [Rhizobacter sp.]